MGDPVIADEARHDKKLSDFERNEVARDRAECAAEEESAESYDLEVMTMQVKESLRRWVMQTIMKELLDKPTRRRVMLYCRMQDMLDDVAKELAKEKVNESP